MAELRRLGVTIMNGTKAIAIASDGLEVEREDGPGVLPADSIVIAAGAEPENSHVSEIETLVSEVYTIGDAKEPRDALAAIEEGYLVGLKI
jgi:2,4-dienoyl-CoA reductase (NADPH2)